ncbi:MAG: fatty-acid--CoA ligase [Betaproteobacteria bacterium RIFCSPLOWO2_12_FULL_68_20]|nr:MAG: fatty-acid--CoA ligase [Betaproteobacteria bacterium RIFCSPLOWO2_12_FULL_68_20]
MSWQARTLGEILEEQAAHRADEPALVTETARLSYRQLLQKAKRAAGAMHAMGIRRGDHVGILASNGEHWIVLFYGAALIGAVTVPVNTRFKAAELAFCLSKSDCKALFYVERFLKQDFAAMVREVRPALPKLKKAVVLESIDFSSGPAASERVGPEDLLLIQFTSGTTAVPKGAMLTHHNMLRNAWAAGTRIGIRPEDRYFNCRPLFHVGGSTLSALMSLVAGACLVTLPTFDAGAALATMERERCTLTSGNDTIFQMLMGHQDFAKRKLVLRGGWAAAGPQTMRKIIDVLGAKAICAAYGLSEASPNVVMSDWRDPEELRVEGLAKPHEGVEVRISPEGEIQVRGWNVMRGYYNDPEQTAAAFTADGWLRTGDLGELAADGRLRMVGRLKDVFRVGGENVAPAEVEEVLLAHPAVEAAQVVGVPDARLGEVACAYVTLKSSGGCSEQDLVEWCRARCANFRVPRYLKIVPDFETIGMTASGKVQKAKLREHAIRELGLQPAPPASAAPATG